MSEPGRIPGDDLQRPIDVGGTWAVNALACSGSHLAVGETDARDALLIDTTTGNATALPFPAGYQMNGVAMNAAGIAAFGLQRMARSGDTRSFSQEGHSHPRLGCIE